MTRIRFKMINIRFQIAEALINEHRITAENIKEIEKVNAKTHKIDPKIIEYAEQILNLNDN